MTRAEKTAEVQRLRSKGLTYREIGERIGVSTAYAWALGNPERKRELNRRADAREKEKGRNRRRDAANRARGECGDCGALLPLESKWKGTKQCRECYEAEKDRERLGRWYVIATLWAEGLPMKEIVKDPRVNRSTVGALGVEMDRMKKAGFHLPPRRKGWLGNYAMPGAPSKEPQTKHQVRERVGHAIRSGKLVRPTTCERCGAEGRLQAHHEDYSKPLEVEWLCRPCHTREHGNVPGEEVPMAEAA